MTRLRSTAVETAASAAVIAALWNVIEGGLPEAA
jgi:hypothetical protein